MRILDADGNTTGAGFLVAGRLAVTCAHVVEAAGSGPGQAVRVRFHRAGQPQAARVLAEGWSPCQHDKNPSGDDVAFMELDTCEGQPVALGFSAQSGGHDFLALGYPEGGSVAERWGQGQVGGLVQVPGHTLPLLQIQGVEVDRGLSGGPVLDRENDRVVGMVTGYEDVARRPPAPALRIAYATAAETLQRLRSELCLLPPGYDPACLEAYRRGVLERTQYVNLEGIPLPSDRSGRRVKMRLPLDRVYIRLQAVEEKRRRQQETEERRGLEAQIEARRTGGPSREVLGTLRLLGEYFYRRGQVYQAGERPEPVDPQEALEKHLRLVMLGAPGSGKSTLLHFLARRAAEDARGPLPILASLRDYATALAGNSMLSLCEFALRREAGGDTGLHRALEVEIEAGRVLWLVDALDEARGWSRQAAGQVGQLKGRLVVTSRPLGYVPPPGSLPEFEVLPLTPENADDFLRRWFALLAEARTAGPEWMAQRADWLEAQLQAHPHLQPLARSPLLLTFLAVLAGEDPQRELPADRAELYRRYVEELLDSWEAWRRPREGVGGEPAFVLGLLSGAPARRAALDCFYYLGWALHLAYYGGRPQGAPNGHTLSTALAGYLRHNCEWAQAAVTDLSAIAEAAIGFWQEAGLLATWHLDGEDYLAFRHLTFEEYAAAWALERAWKQEPRRPWAFLRPRLHHYAWREPVLLLASLLDAGGLAGLVRRILAARSRYERHLRHDLRLAAAVLGERPDLDARLAQRVLNWLEKIGRSQFSKWWTREVAFTALAQVGRPAISALLQAFKDSDDWTRKAAAEALGETGNPRAIPALLMALDDSEWFVREAAVEALRHMGDPQVVPALLGALGNSDPYVREVAAEALGQTGDLQAVSALLLALEDSESGVRRAAAQALGQIDDPQAVPPLLEALQDGDSNVREAAAQALGQIDDPQAVPPLLEALQDGNSNVREAAAQALGQIDDPQAIPVLLRALGSPYVDVRQAAAKALRLMGEPQAVPVLLRALENGDSYVRWAAAEALGQIGDPQAVSALLQTLRDSSDWVRRAAVEALGQIGDPQAVPALLWALGGSDWGVRLAVAEALGQMGGPQVVPALLRALGDSDPDMRRAAAQALGQIGDPQAVPDLLRAVGDGDWSVRRAAAQALGQTDDPQAIPALLRALKDRDLDVRRAASEALDKIGGPQAVPVLLQVLEDRDPYVRWAAAQALERIPSALDSIPRARQAVAALRRRGEWDILENVANRLVVLEAATARAPDPLLPVPPVPAWRRAVRWLARAGGLALAALAFAVLSDLLADQLKVSVPLPLQLLLLLALAALAVAMVEASFQQWKV
jgi:HEAT repeat protein